MRRSNDLNLISEEPTFLEKMGFKRREAGSDWVYYERKFDSIQSQLRFILQIEFETYTADDVTTTYIPTGYNFNRAYLKVINRRMDEEEDNDQIYDEETEKPVSVGRYKISLDKVSQLRSLCEMLTWDTDIWALGSF